MLQAEPTEKFLGPLAFYVCCGCVCLDFSHHIKAAAVSLTFSQYFHLINIKSIYSFFL